MDPITGSTNASTCNCQNASNKTQDKKPPFNDFFAMLEYFRQFTKQGAPKSELDDGNNYIQANGWSPEIWACKGNNVIQANGWSPEIYLGDGDDLVEANGWAPEIWAGAGNNIIQANGWSPEIHVGTGEDFIEANGWSPEIYGGKGDDKIEANGHSPEIHGGAGDDLIEANGHSPRIHGGEGNDHIQANGFSGDIRGDAGDDIIQSKGMATSIRGGTGNDTISSEGHHTETSGGKGADNIQAIGDYAAIDGGYGNDIIRGAGFNQLLKGGAGHDDIVASGDAAQVYGGAGNDTITVKYSGSIAAFLHMNTKTGKISNPTHSKTVTPQEIDGGETTKENPESNVPHPNIFRPNQTTDVFGGTGDDIINLENAKANLHFNTGDGVDTVTGGTLDDTLVLGKDLLPENTTYGLKDNNLTIGFGGSDDQVILQGWSMEDSPQIQFSDGTIVTGKDIQKQINSK